MKSIKEYIFKKGAYTRTPVNGNFELTARCNFNCKMCYIHTSAQEAEKCGKELSSDEWIALGKKAVEKGTVYILLTGGEPLLRNDFCHIYSSLVQMGLMVSINTNGSLINDEIIECFRTYRPERVNITVYGACDKTYYEVCGCKNGWQTVSRNIDKLLAAGVLITINTTFTKLNVNEMKDIVAFAKERNIPIRMSGHLFESVRGGNADYSINLSPQEQGVACAEFDKMTLDADTFMRRVNNVKASVNRELKYEIQDESKASQCMAGKSSFWISWDGKMLPCGMLYLHTQDVRTIGFSAAWKNTVDECEKIFLPKECTFCKYRPICSSCAAIFECSSGSSDKLDDNICIKTRTYADRFLKEN